MSIAPYAESPETARVESLVHDIQQISITKNAGQYFIAGKKVDGAPVGWRGTNKDNALSTFYKFMARLV